MSTCCVFKYLENQSTAIYAGKFRYSSLNDNLVFTYDNKYMRNSRATPVDPFLLPLQKAPVILSHDVLGAIRDAAPDFWGRLVISRSLGVNPESLHEIDFLMHANAARIGDLDFRLLPTSPEPVPGPPEFADLAEIIAVAEEVEQERNIAEDRIPYLQLLKQGSSLGGARPKCTVQLEDKSLWLAKFPAIGDRWSNARVEGATMQLASLCGIRVPEMRLKTILGKDVLLSKRFDRNGEFRTGYLSGLSMLGISDRDRANYSYLKLADKLRRDNPKDLPELFRRMIYNVLCRNTDDHPRNHGFLWGKDFFRLAPAFDITPTPSSPGISTTAYLSMQVGKEGRAATLSNCLSCCERFGLTRDDALYIIGNMTDITLGWQQVFKQCEVSERDMEIFRHTFSQKEMAVGKRVEINSNGEEQTTKSSEAPR